MKALVCVNHEGQFSAYQIDSFEMKRLVFSEMAGSIGGYCGLEEKPDFDEKDIDKLPLSYQEDAWRRWDYYLETLGRITKRSRLLEAMRNAKNEGELLHILMEMQDSGLTDFCLSQGIAEMVDLQ